MVSIAPRSPTSGAPRAVMRVSCPSHARVVRRVALPALVVAQLATAGCYRYTEVPVASLQPGAEVRARLTAVAVDRLRDGGSGAGRLIEDFTVTGRVSRIPSDSLVLDVTVAQPDATFRGPSTLASLALARADLRSAELRRIDRGRTTLTVAAIGAAAVAFAVFAVNRGGRSLGTIPGPGGPTETRIPLGVRLAIP